MEGNSMSAKEQVYQFCATNMLTHDTKSVIMALKEKAASISVEACLNSCGDCRKGAFCLADKAQITFTSLADLEHKLNVKTVL
jgi:uncharacterized protein YuzB (UPF0349 family)